MLIELRLKAFQRRLVATVSHVVLHIIFAKADNVPKSKTRRAGFDGISRPDNTPFVGAALLFHPLMLTFRFVLSMPPAVRIPASNLILGQFSPHSCYHLSYHSLLNLVQMDLHQLSRGIIK